MKKEKIENYVFGLYNMTYVWSSRDWKNESHIKHTTHMIPTYSIINTLCEIDRVMKFGIFRKKKTFYSFVRKSIYLLMV